MHAHIIAAATPDGNWQYATESWSKGGAILGLAILAFIVAIVVGAARRVAS